LVSAKTRSGFLSRGRGVQNQGSRVQGEGKSSPTREKTQDRASDEPVLRRARQKLSEKRHSKKKSLEGLAQRIRLLKEKKRLGRERHHATGGVQKSHQNGKWRRRSKRLAEGSAQDLLRGVSQGISTKWGVGVAE